MLPTNAAVLSTSVYDMAQQEFAPEDRLHRLAKQALDSGAAGSIEEAEQHLGQLQLSIQIDEREARHPAQQAALLTAITLGRRIFLGGVFVKGYLDVPICTPLLQSSSLAGAVLELGGRIGTTERAVHPHITIGGDPRPRRREFDIRTSCAGWRGGVVPCAQHAPGLEDAIPQAAMLSAALAISEAFAFARGENGSVGHRDVGFSLWDPRRDWLKTWAEEPSLEFLPTRLWLLGLGHIGQAFLWGLGLLPYPDPGKATLLLQDIDTITPSTESTSVLTDRSLVSRKKTRAMAAWAERRGFKTTICERRFDATTRRGQDEPGIALCGFDNALARRALDNAGFDLVVEAGLGRGFDDFRALRIHILPGTRSASELWKDDGDTRDLSSRPAYQQLRAAGMDQCGVTLLAGKAVGAPFVGAVASSLAIAEVLRFLHGGPLHQMIDLDLVAPEHHAFVQHQRDFGTLNPGFVRLARPRS